MEDNSRFLDMMERYFGQESEAKLPEQRPELHFQARCECNSRTTGFQATCVRNPQQRLISLAFRTGGCHA